MAFIYKLIFAVLSLLVGAAVLVFFLLRSGQQSAEPTAEDQLLVLDQQDIGDRRLVLVLRTTGFQEKVDFLEVYPTAPSYKHGRIVPDAVQSTVVEYKLDANSKPTNRFKRATLESSGKEIVIEFDDGTHQAVPLNLGTEATAE